MRPDSDPSIPGDPARLPADREQPRPEVVEQAAAVVRGGGLVAYPTEHFYALACDPWNRDAVRRLFALKRRPHDKPILLGIHDRKALERVALPVPEAARALVAAWPPGLTLVLPARPEVPPGLTGGTGTVGVRLIRSPLAAALIGACGGALPATSANLSGGPASGDPNRVAEALPGLNLIVDAGRLPPGPVSTILDVTGTPWRVLREGGAGREALAAFGLLAPAAGR